MSDGGWEEFVEQHPEPELPAQGLADLDHFRGAAKMVTVGSAFDWSDPLTTVWFFLEGLADPAEYYPTLHSITTPESAAQWGDFTDAAARLLAIEDPGYGSIPHPAFGDPQVVYVSVRRNASGIAVAREAGPVLVAAAITLVWRSPENFWMVHHFGDTVRPEDVPHG